MNFDDAGVTCIVYPQLHEHFGLHYRKARKGSSVFLSESGLVERRLSSSNIISFCPCFTFVIRLCLIHHKFREEERKNLYV